MKTFLSRYLTLSVLALSGGSSLLHAAGEPAPLQIFTAVEVEFGTVNGKVYQLQGSSNLVDWVSIGDPVFGVGRPVDRVFSTRNGGEVAFGTYRLQELAAPTNGLAPWSLAGLTLNLDDQPGDDLVQFKDDTTGTDLPSDAFRYTFTRIDADTVQAEVTRGGDRRELLTLTFTATGRGTWSRDEFRKQKLTDRDVGVFSVVSNALVNPPTGGGTGGGPIDPPPVEPIPSSLTGLAYLFLDGGSPDRLDFQTATTGLEVGDDVGDDEPNTFTYVHTATGAKTATVVVTFKADRWDEYELTFVDGGHGEYVRREYRNNRLKDTDRGPFSAVKTGVPPVAASQGGGTDDPANHDAGDDQGGLNGGGGSDDAPDAEAGDDKGGQTGGGGTDDPANHDAGDDQGGLNGGGGSDDAPGAEAGDDKGGQTGGGGTDDPADHDAGDDQGGLNGGGGSDDAPGAEAGDDQGGGKGKGGKRP
jgi:hypothetical protein